MRGILIPVKRLDDAKQRLALHFSAQARRALADALWQDFFDVVAQARGIGRIFVVSAEAEVLHRARALGWETIAETQQISESTSVDAASQRCAAMGLESLLRLPVDLPMLEPSDMEAILERAQDIPSATIVASRDGDGTNALLRTPPTLFPSRFGPGSFAQHQKEAERAGAPLTILRNRRVELDIDDLGDLEVLAAIGQRLELRAFRTRAWLVEHFDHRRKVSGRG